MTQLEKNNNNYQTIIYILACLSSSFGLLRLFADVWFWTYIERIRVISDLLLIIVPLIYILFHNRIRMLVPFLITIFIILYNLISSEEFIKIKNNSELFSFSFTIASLIYLLFFILVIKDEIIIIYKKFKK